MTTPRRKQKLVHLGAEILADALLSLAVHSEEANDLIEQLTAPSTENVQRFKKKLSGLKNREHFYRRGETAKFARELKRLLQEIKSDAADPLTGVELLAAFYEADDTIFRMCDDSNGYVGDVFRHDARELFVDHASRCDDKGKVADIILKVNKEDGYGIRDTLIGCSGLFLPEEVIRRMIMELQKRAEKDNTQHGIFHNLLLVESLARQIKDAPLFERTCLTRCEDPSVAAHKDIAQAYLESGDVETAHSWLKRIPEGETFLAEERDELLKEIYLLKGDSRELTKLLSQRFRNYRSVNTLQALLDVIGPDQRDEVIADAVEQILSSDELQEHEAGFLIAVGKIDEAETYLLNRADQLNGDNYYVLLSLAEDMESRNRHLVTSLIFRSLLLSILRRGYIRSYPHGVRYLRKLDRLAAGISDWGKLMSHEAFKERIMKEHGRKRSFWSKYRAKK